MKYLITLFLIAALTSSAFGETGNTDPLSPVKWKLKINSNCVEYVESNHCIAKYDFEVSFDGTFKVGPGPRGEVETGVLTSEESEVLRNLVKPVLFESSLNIEHHTTIEPKATIEPKDAAYTLALTKDTGAQRVSPVRLREIS